MANSWLRLWHDMPTDPKWRTIARVSGQSISLVQSVYLQLLVDASRNVTRGHVTVTVEDIASALDTKEGDVSSVIEAMQGRVLDSDKLTGWETRQPAKEDAGDPISGAKSAVQRKREQREREQLEREKTTPSQDVTNGHDESRNVTTDKDKEEIKNVPRVKRESDPRHTPFKQACEKYYEHHKLEMAWSASEAKQLSELLAANPALTLPNFQDLLRNRSKSQVNHAERPRVWLARATDYASGPLDKFKNPVGTSGPKVVPPSPGNYSALEEVRELKRKAIEEKTRQEAELANKAS